MQRVAHRSGAWGVARLLLLRRISYPVLLAAGLALCFATLVTDVRQRITSGPNLQPVTSTAPRRLVPLTSTDTSLDGFASWSLDGRQVLFMRGGQIWSALPQERQLTGRPGFWDSVPRWVDGKDQIAFVRLNAEDGTARVVLRSLATGKERDLVQESEPIGYIAVSPDGKDLVYTTKSRIVKLEKLGRQRNILAAGGNVDLLAGGIAYAPDGKTLIFGMGEQGTLNLYRIPAAGGAVTRLTEEGGIMPAFAPGGGQVVYRRPAGISGIWLLDLASGQSQMVVQDTAGALLFHPAYGPGGQSLLLSRLHLNRDGRPTSDIVSLNLTEGGR